MIDTDNPNIKWDHLSPDGRLYCWRGSISEFPPNPNHPSFTSSIYGVEGVNFVHREPHQVAIHIGRMYDWQEVHDAIVAKIAEWLPQPVAQ